MHSREEEPRGAPRGSRLHKKWIPKKIRQALHEERLSGRPLNSHAMLSRRGGLYRAALELFGSWRRALQAVGIPLPPRKRKWTRERILSTLSRRHLAGKPPSAKKALLEEGGLYAGAVREFGSWERALKTAGVRIKSTRWTRERVLDELRQRSREGLDLRAAKCPGRLARAAKEFFRSWRRALKKARVALPPLGRPRASRHKVL
jgi:hypothetical protein